MAGFPILYTGKDTTRPLKEYGDTFEQFSNKYLGAKQAELNKALKDEEFFLSQGVDPAPVIADQAMEEQAAMLDWYNDKYADRMAKKDGMLDTRDKMEMAQDKRKVLSRQQNWMASQEQYKKDLEVIRRDFRGDYDRQAFEEATKNFMETGEYSGGLEPNAISPTTALRGVPLSNKARDDEFYGNNLDDFAMTVKAKAMENPRFLKGLIQDFRDLPENEKVKWLDDTDEDGRIGRGELDPNGIIRWAQQNEDYFNAYRVKRPKSERTTVDTEGYNKKKPVTTGNNLNNAYPEHENAKVGSAMMDKYVVLGGESKTFDPIRLGNVYRLYKKEYEGETLKGYASPEQIVVNQEVQFDIAGYSPDKDWAFIVPKNDNILEDDETYAVPAEDLDNILKKHYGISREAYMEKYGANATPAKKKLY